MCKLLDKNLDAYHIHDLKKKIQFKPKRIGIKNFGNLCRSEFIFFEHDNK